ncbi:MAG TPA: hypothetical protein VNJ07_10875 [Chitinophagales bacterium]|nr:hypothetical protein [Chitinophagales bacterium]
MQHRKLIEVLKRLTPDQMDRLRDFIHSPYFNKNHSVSAVFDYMRSLHPHYAEEGIANKEIFKNVESVKDDGDLANKLTHLLELTGKFLSFENNDDLFLEQIGTLKAFKKMHLRKHFAFLAKQLRKKLKNEPFKDFDHLWRVHKLEEELFEGFDNSQQRTPDNSMDKVMKSLECFYFYKKLYYLSEALFRERLLGKSIKDENKREILDFLEAYKMNKDLYLTLYGNIFKMNLEKSPKEALPYYLKVKSAIKESAESIQLEEIRRVCVYLQNFCVNLINKGNKDYLKEYLEIIQFRISKGILVSGERINPQEFKNITKIAIKLNKTTWVENFIENFHKYLPDEYRSDYYNLVLGELYYHKNEFTKASHHLAVASHNKNDVYFGFAVKKLLLKIGYESNDFALDSYLEMYKKHLYRYRNKIGENAPLLEKFYRYFRLLAKSDDADDMEILLSKLLAEENFADKDWLITMTSKKLNQPYFQTTALTQNSQGT